MFKYIFSLLLIATATHTMELDLVRQSALPQRGAKRVDEVKKSKSLLPARIVMERDLPHLLESEKQRLIHLKGGGGHSMWDGSVFCCSMVAGALCCLVATGCALGLCCRRYCCQNEYEPVEEQVEV